MEEHIKKGKGVKSRFGEHLWLDITLLGEHHIRHNLREVHEICPDEAQAETSGPVGSHIASRGKLAVR
jgi:succinate dehydrogenase/fumarate reductase flavoprotein subunit